MLERHLPVCGIGDVFCSQRVSSKESQLLQGEFIVVHENAGVATGLLRESLVDLPAKLVKCATRVIVVNASRCLPRPSVPVASKQAAELVMRHGAK